MVQYIIYHYNGEKIDFCARSSDLQAVLACTAAMLDILSLTQSVQQPALHTLLSLYVNVSRRTMPIDKKVENEGFLKP